MGNVCEETLVNLDVLDRHLLLACATASLVAVRWLLRLGASPAARDTNSSTCLHVACRSGSLPVVCEVLRHAQVDDIDVAGWTPLHIAAHMGRRVAAARLLRARASLASCNCNGETPLEVCMDTATLEVLRGPAAVEVLRGSLVASPEEGLADLAAVVEFASNSGALQDGGLDVGCIEDDSVGMPVHCQPSFFNVFPQPSIEASGPHRTALRQIAAAIFAMSPGYGLAFALASGAMDSYTSAFHYFLKLGGACRIKLGSFLSEAFSLSTMIRFSVLDSLPLLHTGVLGALCQTCSVLQLPEDLPKIERLLQTLAHAWWRRHQMLLSSSCFGRPQPPKGDVEPGQPSHPGDTVEPTSCEANDQEELCGVQLMQYLASSDALCQLMLSTVLLHWFVHSNGSGAARSLSFEEWFTLNRGIDLGGTDVTVHVQRGIHAAVHERWRPELMLSKPAAATALSVTGRSTEQCIEVPPRKASAPRHCRGARNPEASAPKLPRGDTPPDGVQFPVGRRPAGALSMCASVEGCVQLLGNLPELAEANSSCEHTGYLGLAPGLTSEGVGITQFVPPLFASGHKRCGNGADGIVWASLCSICLLFFTWRGEEVDNAPYALTDARSLCVAEVCAKRRVITLRAAAATGEPAQEASITCVVLLPDGRWHTTFMKALDLKVQTGEELLSWVSHLSHRSPKDCLVRPVGEVLCL